MANEEHLAILKQGVEVWNRWREENPDIRPDLRGADLRGADLGWANLGGANLGLAILGGANLGWAILCWADLSRADLREANLRKADLRGADLSGANLSEANLSGADLREANLTLANLSGANLSGAILGGANLSGAKLGGANLSGADLGGANVERAEVGYTTLGYTIFGDVDLSVVKGLDTVYHRGPSTIGIDTIYKSKGKIPQVFLRGCGVPDTMITYIGSLVGQPIGYYSCFISYSVLSANILNNLPIDGKTHSVTVHLTQPLDGGGHYRTR
jgi:uncharacterized protein YjbI with pentapeptide repeats